MKRLLIALLLLWPMVAQAQGACATGSICVSDADLKTFLALANEKKCLQTTQPAFKLDPVVVVVDKEGRVYYSGDEPKPYTLKMSWCTYELTATGKVALTVAKNEPPVWGFRFRPKFAGSYLFVDGFSSTKAVDGVDIGILWDLAYYKAVNFNIATGFRSVGAGLGLDITRNFGGYAGYAFSWWTLKHNPQLGLYFAFW
jgi:hypothetical protein